jgi:hypothetical protein
MNINSRIEQDLYSETEEYLAMMNCFNSHGGKSFRDVLKESYEHLIVFLLIAISYSLNQTVTKESILSLMETL